VIATNPAELGELEAMRDLFAACPPESAAELGVAVSEIAGAVCISLRAAQRSAMFNRVLGLGLATAPTEQDVEAIDAFYRKLGVDYCVALAPEARPPELREWLTRRRLSPAYRWAKFRRRAGDPPIVETALRLERVGRDRAADFARVFVCAYETPAFFEPWVAELPGRKDWHCYVAYAGHEPAATGALYMAERVGWLGMAATMPKHRRKGAQNAILAARIEAAADEGCDLVVTETGALAEGRPSNSYRNIQRAGFEFAYERDNYLSSPNADTSGTRSSK
jgi:GNAT superfamily N-acetyltransferase